MPKKSQHKIAKICGRSRQKDREGRRIKIWLLVVAAVIMSAVGMPRVIDARAINCPDVRVVFARGSGGERWQTDDYLAFKASIENKLATTGLKYEFIDLDYPAVGVGIDHLGTAAGAFFGSGDAYEFGESVNNGVRNLAALINNASCPETKYVLGGYSQGAMVVSKSLGSLRADRVIYAATFGDPKLYLPEGKGLIPAACQGGKLSDYRMHVPDCRAYKGLLGAYIPYEPVVYEGKVGTWCNRRDVMCSSHISISDHLAYVSENLYEDASRVIFDKICKAFGVENHISSPHDTAILIDSTGSMEDMIDAYKAEALRLASETLAAGGRVALYDYRDLADPYQPIQHCDFENCTLDIFRAELDEITVDGGGDTSESLLSASLHVMRSLRWKQGSTKSLVILTDADFLSPDRDGVSFDEVVQLSKTIDPVNFYIITTAEYGSEYAGLAAATEGKVVTDFNELSLLTDYIMERYDSLPRVEESAAVVGLPTVAVSGVSYNDDAVKVEFTLSGGSDKVLVVLNDYVLGIVEADNAVGTVTIGGLDIGANNVLALVPLSDDARGEVVEVELSGLGRGGTADDAAFIPKAPNTGKH